jgi:large subunit ribosomal protein L28
LFNKKESDTLFALSQRSEIMAKRCQVTGKVPVTGKSYAIRGIAKKKKGIGLKVTGIKRRRFLPNLVKKRFWFAEENRFITIRLSTGAMRTIDKVGLSTIIRQMRASGENV